MACVEREGPRAVACLLMLATFGAAFAQSDLERAAPIERRIHDRIVSEQTENGAHAATLIPLFTELAHLYREQGHEDRAAAAFEAARGVIRANRGFSSLDEAPLLEELIRIEENLGYVESAWDREQDLLALAGLNSSDLRSAEIYREVGDKRLDLLNRYRAGEFPPQLILGCYYDPALLFRWGETDGRNCTAGSRGVLVRAVTLEALRYYAAVAKTLFDRQLYASAELHDLEMRIVRSAYELGAYSFGRRSLVRLLSYDVARAEPLLARIDALLEIADWDIVTTQKTASRFAWGSALETYEQAYAKLRTVGANPESIEVLFEPDVPVVLPTFLPNPLVSRRTPDTTGHIDVAFEVTKYGRARRIDVLDSTTNASRDAKRDLVRQIARGVFRPRLIDGKVADAAPVVLRYYVARSSP